MIYMQFRILRYRVAPKSEYINCAKGKLLQIILAKTANRSNLLNIYSMNVNHFFLLWYEVQEWITEIGFDSYYLEIRFIIFG